MKRIESYVHKLFKEIPNSDIKKSLEDEITTNLEEKVLDLIEEGKTEEDAINKALIEFGDIEDIKKELLEQCMLPEPTSKQTMKLIFSLCATGLIVALFLFINFYYTPQNIWFVYPVFVVIWWPFIMFYKWYEHKQNARRNV